MRHGCRGPEQSQAIPRLTPCLWFMSVINRGGVTNLSKTSLARLPAAITQAATSRERKGRGRVGSFPCTRVAGPANLVRRPGPRRIRPCRNGLNGQRSGVFVCTNAVEAASRGPTGSPGGHSCCHRIPPAPPRECHAAPARAKIPSSSSRWPPPARPRSDQRSEGHLRTMLRAANVLVLCRQDRARRHLGREPRRTNGAQCRLASACPQAHFSPCRWPPGTPMPAGLRQGRFAQLHTAPPSPWSSPEQRAEEPSDGDGCDASAAPGGIRSGYRGRVIQLEVVRTGRRPSAFRRGRRRAQASGCSAVVR